MYHVAPIPFAAPPFPSNRSSTAVPSGNAIGVSLRSTLYVLHVAMGVPASLPSSVCFCHPDVPASSSECVPPSWMASPSPVFFQISNPVGASTLPTFDWKEMFVTLPPPSVDSSVTAALIHRALGDRLTCVFVNHGLLRKNEPEMVQQVFARTFNMKLVYIDASDRFLDKLAGVADPEKKRKIIGSEFIDVFAEAAEKIHAPFLGQGTIYPDILESIPFDGNPKGVIKSHHNVGGLPENLKFKLVEPLERLFKDEVRKVGRLLGLPSELLDRHPFPGPSLGVRHVGPIDRKTLNILREADAIVTDELLKSGWYHKTWQTFAVFVPVRSVGMKNHQRTYDYVIAIRSINTVDAVTAEVVRLPWELLFSMSQRIIAEVEGVNRVVYDITQKPPGTIEWE